MKSTNIMVRRFVFSILAEILCKFKHYFISYILKLLKLLLEQIVNFEVVSY